MSVREYSASATLTALLVAGTPAMGATSSHPQEVVGATEATQIQEIVGTIEAEVRAQFGKDGLATRDAHAKHHGCVKAEVSVLDNLSDQYKVGVFAQRKTYRAIIRFSNGMGSPKDDREGDARGFALKLLDVPGTKLLEEEQAATTQDFVMINHPVFFIRNVPDYVEFSKAQAAGSPLSFFIGWNPFQWHLKEALIANSIRSKTVTNPVEFRYFSTTPILMGDVPAKYAVTPCEGQTFAKVASSPSQLREALVAQLDPSSPGPGVCFELGVQLQTSQDAMPVEDPTEEWSEQESPFVTVATINIPRQEFLGQQALTDCENMSFTPWHALPEHRPLGGIQRVRKEVYRAISKLRHDLNGQRQSEP